MSINGQIVLAENSAGNGLQRLKLDSSGRLECSVNEIEVTASSINVKTAALETLQTATNSKIDTFDAVLDASLVKQTAMATDLAALEVLQTATNSALTTIDGVLDNILVKNTAGEIHLGNIDTGIDVLEACVGSNKVNVNISSGNITGFGTASNQATIIGHVDGIETSLTAITGYVDGLETLQTATNSALGTIDGVLDNSLVKQTAMATDLAALEVLQTATNSALTTMDGVLDNSLVKQTAMATDLAALEVLQTATNSALTTMDGVLDNSLVKQTAMATDLAALEVLQTATNSALTTMDGVLDNILVKNTAAETHLGNIDTGVDVLEACVGSNKVNVNISSGNISGFSTASNQSTIIGHVDGIETLLGATNTDLAAIEVLLTSANTDHAANEALLITIDEDTNNIKTSTAACATDLAALEVLQTATNQKLDDIETAVQLIDDAIKTEDLAHSSGDKGIPCLMVRQDSHSDLAADGDYMIPTINANGEIRVTSSAASGGATEAKQDDMETTLDAILAKNSEIETTNNANQVLLGTIDSDTDAIKTSAAALVVDLAAIEVLITAGNALLTTIDSDTNDIKTATELNSGSRVTTSLDFGTVANGSPEALPASTGLTLNNSSERLGYFITGSSGQFSAILEQSFDGNNWFGQGNLNGSNDPSIFGSEIKVGKYARLKITHGALGNITISLAALVQ